MHRVDHPVIVVNHGNHTLFVEDRARARDTEADQIAGSQLAAGWHCYAGMLFVEPGHG